MHIAAMQLITPLIKLQTKFGFTLAAWLILQAMVYNNSLITLEAWKCYLSGSLHHIIHYDHKLLQMSPISQKISIVTYSSNKISYQHACTRFPMQLNTL
jgi:hypothetical protein